MICYPAFFAPAEEGGFVVTFPDVPEAITQGEDLADAIAMAKDALETALSFYLDEGKDLPKPSRPKGKHARMVPASLSVATKLAHYAEMRRAGVRKA